MDEIPQILERCSTTITNHPRQNARLLMVDCGPNPNLVALVANKCLKLIEVGNFGDLLGLWRIRQLQGELPESSALQWYGEFR